MFCKALALTATAMETIRIDGGHGKRRGEISLFLRWEGLFSSFGGIEMRFSGTLERVRERGH